MILETYKGFRGYRSEQGVWYPAVGEGLELCYPTPMEWIAQADLDEGAACHAQAAAAVSYFSEMGQLPPANWLKGPIRPRVQRFLDWYIREGYVLIEAERPEANKTYGFAGCPDITGHHPRSTIGHVLELKFSESLIPRYHAQATVYTHLDRYKGFRAFLVQIPREGRLKVVPVKPDPQHWVDFLSALGVIRCRLRNRAA